MVGYVPMSGQQSGGQHAMRRIGSFSAATAMKGEGEGDGNGVYQRSQSFGCGGTGRVHAFASNFFASPPSSPVGGKVKLSMLDDEEGGKGGFFDELGKVAGRPDLRGLTLPPGSPLGGGVSAMGSPTFSDALFNKFLPSNNEDEEAWPAVDMYGCDQFRMFEFKVRRCMRGRSHDWTECPFAHPGEKARRRDPRRFHYSGTACPDFRKGSCRRGDACEFAHGVFECWLHPARYRTQPCKDGRNCRRRVCFFAHTPEQLRLLPNAAATAARNGGSYDGSARASAPAAASYNGVFAYDALSYDGATVGHMGSPLSHFSGYSTSAAHSGGGCVASQNSSPRSTLVGHMHYPPPISPPLSPAGSPPLSPSSLDEWANVGSSFGSPSMSGMSGDKPAMSLQVTLAQARSHNAHVQTSPVPAHRRHLDRLNSMPTLSIPCTGEHRGAQQQHGGGHSGMNPGSSPSSPSGVTQKSIMELIETLQQLEVRGSPSASAAQLLQQQYTTGPSPLRRCSQSVPGTPTKVSGRCEQKEWWEVDEDVDGEPMAQRVESGRDLRAKIYGRLSLNLPHNVGLVGPVVGDSPDLDWVNELVKEEAEQSPAW